MNIFLGFIVIVITSLDFSYRDQYKKFFLDDPDFEPRDNLSKIIDIFLLCFVVITYILLIIVLCYVRRENNMCDLKLRFTCCGFCYLCEIDCCTLCPCFDKPPVIISHTNSLNDQPYIQQQNVLVVQQNGYPINNNNCNNDDNNNYNHFKSNKVHDYSTNLDMSSSAQKIHLGKKKSTNSKKKKNKNTTTNLSCIEKKYNNKYENIPICAICNIDFKEGEDILVLPCQHIFHNHCANNWLKSNNNTCPIDGTKIN